MTRTRALILLGIGVPILALLLFVAANCGGSTCGEPSERDRLVVKACFEEKWEHLQYWPTATVEDTIRCLQAGANPMYIVGHDYETPLHRAAGFNEDAAVTQAMLDAGAHPMVLDRSGETPLHWAAAYAENPAVVTALLDAGADPAARDYRGMTPLHRTAATNENPAVAGLLIEAGADPVARAHDGNTPLYWAAFNNTRPAMTRLFLAHGADPTVQNDDGQTPLHAAARAPLHHAARLRLQPFDRQATVAAIIDLLFEAGAQARIPDDTGRTAWDYAREHDTFTGTDAYRRLEPGPTPAAVANCEDWYSEGYFSAASVEDVVTCTNAGVEPTVWNDRGETPLHHAVALDPAIVEILVSAGAEVNARNRQGQTPLHITTSHNPDPAMIETLLSAGARPDARDDEGLTPLHLAAASTHNMGVDVIVALLEAGADTEARDDQWRTPLHISADALQLAHIEALLVAGADPAAISDDGMTALDYAQARIGSISADITQLLSP